MTSKNANPDFNLADGHGYMLGRSYAAASRLNLQHYLWKESLHFNLHPSIPIPDDALVADVAAGTAIWPIDVAREHPTIQLHCFDTNTSQAPPKQSLPPNITLETWNIFDDVPEHMIGIYDVVHVRLLVLVVQSGDPSDILHNLIRILKPGGHLQWDEFNYHGTNVIKIDSSIHTPALDELQKLVGSSGRNDWTVRLPDFFAEQGLLDIVINHFQDSPDFSRANSEVRLLMMDEFASKLAETGQTVEATTISSSLQDVSHEIANGAALSMPKVVCVGRKGAQGVRRE